jgi:GDP-L-fucose synthase
MIRKFVEAERSGASQVELWGDGSPTREFLYVDDAAEALLATAERYDDREPMNLGSGTEISVRDLANTIRDAVGYTGRVAWDTSKPNGQPRRMLDVSRARDAIGFEARTSLRDGLARTIDYYLAERDAIHAAERARRA